MITVVKAGDVYVIGAESRAWSAETFFLSPGDIEFTNDKNYQIPFKPERIYRKVSKTRNLDCVKDGVSVTHEEYKQLESEFVWPDYDGEFDSLDDEYAWKKFHEGWTFNTEQYYEDVDVEFKIVKAAPSEYSDIKSIYFLGDPIDSKVAQYEYKPNVSGYLRDFANKYNFSFYTDDRRTNEGIVLTNHKFPWEFAKINGQFIFLGDTQNVASRYGRTYRGTYDEVVARRKQFVDEINRYLIKHLPSKASLSDLTAQEILTKLSGIKSSVNQVQSMQKTRHKLGHARNAIKELEDYLLKALENENSGSQTN